MSRSSPPDDYIIIFQREMDRTRNRESLTRRATTLLGSQSMTRVILTLVLIAYHLGFTQAQTQPNMEQIVIPTKQLTSLHHHHHNSLNNSKNNITQINVQSEPILAASTTTISSASSTTDGRQKQQPAQAQTSLSTSSSSVSLVVSTESPVSSSSSSPHELDGAAKQQERRPAGLPSKAAKHQRAAANDTAKLKTSAENRQQHLNTDIIDLMSTSQSVSFAEPAVAASSHQQQHYTKSSGDTSNRWTHFGARIRPLTSASVDHHAAAAISKPVTYSQVAPVGRKFQASNHLDQELDSDELDDDQDNEALLYKMMQQQNFLMNPVWPEPFANEQGNNNGSRTRASSNSNKIIKLLKSYSHIHQVDDSGDQVRGTYTRLPQRRPTKASDNNWQPNKPRQQYRNRSNSRQQAGAARSKSANHIFVSSQPMNQAYSQSASIHYPSPGQALEPAQSSQADEGDPQSEDEPSEPPQEEDEFECPNNGIFADEASGCQAYHVCQSGAQVQQKFQCPMGTLFNNIILTCDFAHNVPCNGKNKQANLGRSNDGPEKHEAIYQPQQTPRASVQVNQGSYVQQNNQHQRQQVPRPAPHQQHQARWMQPKQQHQQVQSYPQASQQQQRPLANVLHSSGPKYLPIGSQYSKHQQRQPSPQVQAQAQAVNDYPQPTTSGDDSDESDEEPLTPLVPATLPPRVANSLPYNPPPSEHQSAHQSQYHTHQQPNYSANIGNRNAYDSAVNPVFASRDEPKTTEASILPETSQSIQPNLQSFNLVINHVASTRQQLKPATVAPPKQVDTITNLPRTQANPPPPVLRKNKIQPSLPAVNKPQLVANHQQLDLPSKQKHHQFTPLKQRVNNNEHLMATQPKSVHIGPDQRAPTRPALVDLTNDKHQTGVSSDSLNNGLLLIVRHGTPMVPEDRQSSPQDYKKPKSDKKLAKQASGGQAYSVDPAVVRPTSAVDAQLFPNVQRVLASLARAAQSSSGSQYMQHIAQSPRHHAFQRVSLPLPPMEPPKPTSLDIGDANSHYNDEATFNVDTQAAASTSLTSSPASAESSQSVTGSQKESKNRSKRTKRLKASQLPTPKAVTTSSITATAHQELTRSADQSQDQSVTVVKPQRRPTQTVGVNNATQTGGLIEVDLNASKISA